MSVNQIFRIVFQPYDQAAHGGKRRFAIGGGRLADYIGSDNVDKAIAKAIKKTKHKHSARIRFRAHGIIDFYNK